MATRPFAGFEWLIAGRYLRARRKERAISAITARSTTSGLPRSARSTFDSSSFASVAAALAVRFFTFAS